MKNRFFRLTAFVLILALLSGFTGALAVRTDYADIKGHWAEAVLTRALSDALIERPGDSVKPNEPMTGAEILTILCRVLSARRTTALTDITDVTETDAYYTAASQAVALGLTAPINGRLDLNKPVARSKAFAEFSEAFQLSAANQDTSVLAEFSDGNTLSGKYRTAAAALISGGFVGGFNGSLHINANITLAEFLTVLYKLVPNYMISDASAAVSGGVVFTGNANLLYTQFTGTVIFDCSSASIQLQNITAPAVILRSDSLNALSVSSSSIDRLVFAAASGDMYFSPDFLSTIKTAVVGTGGGKLTLAGSIPNVEVTGNNREVTITGSVKNLLISGSNNKIIIAPGVMLDAIKILGTGTGNTVTINGVTGECEISGHNTVIDGTGIVQQLIDNSKDSTITAGTGNDTVNEDYGLNGVIMALTAPDNLSAYEALKASVSLTAPEGSRLCRGTWYLDDAFISQSDVNVGTAAVVSLNADIKSLHDAPVTSTLTFVLSYTDANGDYHEIRTDKSLTLQNSSKFDAKEILALVTSSYKGDYTLAWAKANDYDAAVKAEWVKLKGYTSNTNYLVWVNIAYQRVNVFTGSAGNWTLTNTFIVGTGATGKDTPTGVFKVIGRSTKGWSTKTYTVKPVIFFMNTAYGFHSRLYDPGTTTVNDARIGFPVSHGCVRMYDEDVAWFYKNIPTNTTVVVY